MTGAGVVSALGDTVDATWTRLVRGDRAIGPVDLFDTTGLRGTMAAEVRGLEVPTEGFWSRTCVLAARAAEEAIGQSRLDPRTKKVGLVVGGTTGGMYENEARLAKLHADPDSHDTLANLLSHPLTSTGDRLNETLGPFTRVRTICTACSSGANAFAIAAMWLLSGELDAVVAGGTDGLCRLTFSGFNALQAMDPELCRPFDRRRRGLNLGEGAGFAVFERSTSAEARGAAPIAELAGWAISAEAHHITNPEPTGAIAGRTLTRALLRARLAPGDIDYVNAHGTGTLLNDPMESAALARALGKEIQRIPVSSSKGQIGHTLAAAGAIEGIISALAISRGKVPPTAGLEEPDPACPLVHVPRVGHDAKVRAAISSSFGFGGMDTVLVLTEPGFGPGHEGRSHAVVVTGVGAVTKAGLDGAETAARLLEPTTAPAAPGPLDLDLAAHLDVARARRLDRSARLGAIACDLALKEAGVAASPLDPHLTGVVMGSAFGSVDPSAAYIHRLFDKGPRYASPAEFPNLVPSSPVGHMSIYLGVNGPSLATADLATSGESAILEGAELVACGEAHAIAAGATEEASWITEKVFAVIFSRAPGAGRQPRAEGAAAIVLESRESAERRGVKVLARLAQTLEWRDGAEPPLSALRPPKDPLSARIVLPRSIPELDALLATSPWAGVSRSTCAGRAGEHEGLGAVAAAAAVSLIFGGTVREALVVGLAKGRGYAFVLSAPPVSSPPSSSPAAS